MPATTVTLLVLGAIALIAVALLVRGLIAKNQGQAGPEIPALAQSVADLVETPKEQSVSLPSEIRFGTDLANPAVTLRPLPLSLLATVEGAAEVQPSIGVASRISGLMQAAPSLLVAEAHKGRQLMEVVLDGKLIRAADGDGFRAMAMGKDAIREHARLFEAKDLTNLVNAAAVWQLASVIVAQKHMADISQKLGEIKEAVSSISDFLQDERRAVIHGTYQYLRQAYEALSQGELSQAIRGELESCERELLAVQNHLVADIQSKALEALEDDTVGTESRHKSGLAKYRALGQRAEDLKTCLRTRALSWYVLSLYPGEQAVKIARGEHIKQGLDAFRNAQSLVESQVAVDVGRFKSMWNRNETLSARKGEVLGEARLVQEQLVAAHADTSAQLERTQTLLLERDAPTQLIVELVDGVVKQVRQREVVAR
jgi:hypothetical protein